MRNVASLKIPACGNCQGMQVNTQRNCHCCSDSNASLVCISQVFPRNSDPPSCRTLNSCNMSWWTSPECWELEPNPKVKPSVPTANSTNTPVAAHTKTRSYPINLLQKEHGTVPSEVLWQYGVSLPLRCGRHLSAEEEPVHRLRHQSQAKTRRPAVIQHI